MSEESVFHEALAPEHGLVPATQPKLAEWNRSELPWDATWP
jgi:hypothetical protein